MAKDNVKDPLKCSLKGALLEPFWQLNDFQTPVYIQGELVSLKKCLHTRRTGVLEKKQSLPAGYVPVAAYGGCLKNLKDLKVIAEVRQGLFSVRDPDEAQADSFGRASLHLRDVRHGLREAFRPDQAHAHTFGGETAHVRDVRQGLVEVRQPGAAHAVSRQG